MKIGVIGVGAVGGYFGAKLARAGHDVTFIGTERTVKAIREKGLLIKSYQGDFAIKEPKVAHDFKAVQNADIILFCVKSYNTAEVAKALKKRISEKSVIISLQNGVENEDVLAEVFGAQRVIGSVVFITSSLVEPGVIKHTSFGKILLGELNGEISDRVRNIEKLFLNSDIPSGVTSELKKELWKKLMLNVAYNGFTSLVGKPLEKFYDFPEAGECFKGLLKEVQTVAGKEGISITDEEVEKSYKFSETKGFTTFKSSTLLDVEAGKPLEVDTMQGAVLKYAKKHNVDVPMNKLLYALLKLKY